MERLSLISIGALGKWIPRASGVRDLNRAWRHQQFNDQRSGELPKLMQY
jgi:hypothetical protein